MRDARQITIGIGIVWMLAGCGGGSTPTQASARDRAATAACNYYGRCAQIGPGLKYASTDDCLTQLKATFNTAWPQAECVSIVSTGLDNCIGAIAIADCGSVADLLNAALNKCTKDKVCASDAGSGSGG
jgi:hypothetical protein